jgi:hypothetical protein
MDPLLFPAISFMAQEFGMAQEFPDRADIKVSFTAFGRNRNRVGAGFPNR